MSDALLCERLRSLFIGARRAYCEALARTIEDRSTPREVYHTARMVGARLVRWYHPKKDGD